MRRRLMIACCAVALAAACRSTAPKTEAPPPTATTTVVQQAPAAPAPTTVTATATSTGGSASASATAPASGEGIPASALVDRSGDSPQTAVAVPVDVPDEVDFENRWIYDHFGRFRRKNFAIAHSGDQHYDVITFELPDHSEHKAYFDITDLWRKWGKE